jgi:DNA-binding winged helix-turn-helix (wHTH) protein
VRISFGPFILEAATRRLTRSGRGIHLTAKAFDLLLALANDRPNVISKASLQQHLWPDTFVVEANLSNLVAEIRHALGERARAPRYIRTVHGYGYAFCAETATTPSPSSESGAVRTPCWIEWGSRRFPLAAGEHVVGRDSDAGVRLDVSTVSRRHARLVVTREGTTLEDMASKNGTFRGIERVTSPIRLADGDAIRFGSLLVMFHTCNSLATETCAGTQALPTTSERHGTAS